MLSDRKVWKRVTFAAFTLIILGLHTSVSSGRGFGAVRVDLDPRFDTSFAIEYSDSCLSGGCHESDPGLVEEHADSLMTHAMVKCNACHGTHTAETVGQEKPNLTGYYEGIGISGYRVGDDRCIACHTPTLEEAEHPNKTWDCISCHRPHRFGAQQMGRN